MIFLPSAFSRVYQQNIAQVYWERSVGNTVLEAPASRVVNVTERSGESWAGAERAMGANTSSKSPPFNENEDGKNFS